MTNERDTAMEHKDISAYLIPADINHLRCVDERPADDGATIPTNGVQLPGAVYGIIDTIKSLKGVSEADAWIMASKAGIPMDNHDDEHHGPNGCGYGNLVEKEPATVDAPESIPADARAARAVGLGGGTLHLLGDHKPTGAIINHRDGMTMDSGASYAHGVGTFNFDAWAMPGYADKLGLDPKAFTDHLTQVYKKTVTRLTGITEFPEVR